MEDIVNSIKASWILTSINKIIGGSALRVQEILIENNNKRYILLNQEGFPVMPVMKYIKYLDKTGKSPNTQKKHIVIP